MIVHSIRWRLQIWYGLFLAAVLVGFGVAAFQLERGRLFRRVDGELQRRLGPLAQSLRPQPPGPDETPPGGPPPEEAGERRRGPPEDVRPGASRPAGSFHLPPPAAKLFDESDPNG